MEPAVVEAVRLLAFSLWVVACAPVTRAFLSVPLVDIAFVLGLTRHNALLYCETNEERVREKEHEVCKGKHYDRSSDSL